MLSARPRFQLTSLRLKTLLALFALALIILLPAGLIGRSTLSEIRTDFGISFARNHVLQQQQRILTQIRRELALAQRLAGSTLTRRWLSDENNHQAKNQFFAEADQFASSFTDKSYFIISAVSGNYYYNDGKQTYSQAPRYTLRSNNTADTWFYSTIAKPLGDHINVNLDKKLHVTKVWFNIPVVDREQKIIGLAGTGLDLTAFLQDHLNSGEAGTTSMIVNSDGAIQAHPDPLMIEYAAVSKRAAQKTLHRLLASDGERVALNSAMQSLTSGKEKVSKLNVHLDGQPRLLTLAYIAELDWYVISAVDLNAIGVIDSQLLAGIVGVGLILLLALIILVMSGFDRLVLAPLAHLNELVRQVAAGAYDLRLRSQRRDELGELTRNFDSMAERIREHTALLEQRVEERTHALSQAHEELGNAHRKVTDSIRYASLLQSALLPERTLAEHFPGEYFVLWRPRDVVGGDLYFYRPCHGGHLLGIIDCAGHGVPGAFMTMIAHAALDLALARTGGNDPAKLLHAFDATVRTMLPPRERFARIATDMDIALCFIDPAAGQLLFSGAKLALRWCDPEHGNGGEIAGARRAIGEHKRNDFQNTAVALLPGRCFYLSSDGILDQNGGAQGFAFGDTRLRQCLQANVGQSMAEQQIALTTCLDHYCADKTQRDDITLIGFRVAISNAPSHMEGS